MNRNDLRRVDMNLLVLFEALMIEQHQQVHVNAAQVVAVHWARVPGVEGLAVY